MPAETVTLPRELAQRIYDAMYGAWAKDKTVYDYPTVEEIDGTVKPRPEVLDGDGLLPRPDPDSPPNGGCRWQTPRERLVVPIREMRRALDAARGHIQNSEGR